MHFLVYQLVGVAGEAEVDIRDGMKLCADSLDKLLLRVVEEGVVVVLGENHWAGRVERDEKIQMVGTNIDVETQYLNEILLAMMKMGILVGGAGVVRVDSASAPDAMACYQPQQLLAPCVYFWLVAPARRRYSTFRWC